MILIALVKQGIEVVKADYHDRASLVKAFSGAYAVFGLTNCACVFCTIIRRFSDESADWEHMNEQQEVDEAVAQIDAAKEAGVQHFVWSYVKLSVRCGPVGRTTHLSLSSVAANPNRHVAHWTSKGTVNGYLVKSGLPYTV